MLALIIALLLQLPLTGAGTPLASGGGGGGGGTWSHIQSCHASGGNATNIACVLSANPATGNTVVVEFGILLTTATGVACKDGNNNSYTVSGTIATNSTGPLAEYGAYLLSAPANANATITCSWTGSSGFDEIFAGEFKDTGGTPAFDQVVASPANSTASGTTINVPSFTPAVAGSLAYCSAFPNNSVTAPISGGTQGIWTGDNIDNGGAEYSLSTAASAQTCNMTDSSSGDQIASSVIVIKP